MYWLSVTTGGEGQLYSAARRSGGGSLKLLKAMVCQREKLRLRPVQLQSMQSFLDRKIARIEAGARGPAPMHGGELVISGQ